MIIQHLKQSRLMVVALAASLVFTVTIVTNHFKLRAVDPRVTTEFSNRATIKQAPVKKSVIPTIIDGEVSCTADRIGEAAALTIAASLYAAHEQIRGRTPRTVHNILAGLAAQNLLPPGLLFTQIEGTLVSPYGTLSVRYRSTPLAVEVISIGSKPDYGPALIIRVPNETREQGEAKMFMANSLTGMRVPAPFAPAPEVVALGWSPERLHALK